MKTTDITALSQEEQQAIEARRAYQRQWRAANKDKVREHNRRFWLKKTAEQQKGEQPKINQNAKVQNHKQVIERLSGAIEDRGTLPAVSDYEILEAAILKYGSNAQIDMAIEEMSELTKALLKERRYLNGDEPEQSAFEKIENNIAEEMADVIIMLVQLQMIFGNKDKVLSCINSKVKRLKTRLEEKGGGK